MDEGLGGPGGRDGGERRAQTSLEARSDSRGVATDVMLTSARGYPDPFVCGCSARISSGHWRAHSIVVLPRVIITAVLGSGGEAKEVEREVSLLGI